MIKTILCIILPVLIVLTISGCSNKEPVEFSEDLKNDKKCYMDIVEITPDSEDSLYIYCKCKLQNGSTVWMQIFDTDYIQYFDTTASEDDVDFMAKGVKYDKAVRLNGTAKITQDIPEKKDEKITVFSFIDADADITTKTGTSSYSGTDFSEISIAGKYVYADITSISFKNVVNTEINSSSMSFSSMTSAIFECNLADGQTIKILADIDDYKKYIDKSAVFIHDPINPHYPDDISYAEPLRIYGKSIDAKDTFSNLDAMHQAGIIFQFKATDAPVAENSEIENQSEN